MNKPTRYYKRITDRTIFWWEVEIYGFKEASYLIERLRDFRDNNINESRTIHTQAECEELAALRTANRKEMGYKSLEQLGITENPDGSVNYMGQDLCLEEMLFTVLPSPEYTYKMPCTQMP